MTCSSNNPNSPFCVPCHSILEREFLRYLRVLLMLCKRPLSTYYHTSSFPTTRVSPSILSWSPTYIGYRMSSADPLRPPRSHPPLLGPSFCWACKFSPPPSVPLVLVVSVTSPTLPPDSYSLEYYHSSVSGYILKVKEKSS